MRRLVLAAAAIIVLSIIEVAPSAWAHVLVVDDSGQVGAILHVSPADEPVVGQESQLFLDVDRDLPSGTNTAKMTLRDEQGNASDVAAKLTGRQVEADYTFMEQGKYNLEFTIGSGANQLVFRQTVQVVGAESGSQFYGWAITLAVATAIGLLALIIVFVFNVRGVWRQSRF